MFNTASYNIDIVCLTSCISEIKASCLDEHDVPDDGGVTCSEDVDVVDGLTEDERTVFSISS